MPTMIEFNLSVDSSDEFANVVLLSHGTIFERGAFDDAGDEAVKIGSVVIRLVQLGRAVDEHVDAFDAMDAIDGECEAVYSAMFEPTERAEWHHAIAELYGDDPVFTDLLFIQHLELDPAFRGKGIGARAVELVIAAYGASWGIAVCNPLPLQYCGKEAVESAQRKADIAKVREFWTSCAFRQLPNSDYFTRALWQKKQPPASVTCQRTRRTA